MKGHYFASVGVGPPSLAMFIVICLMTSAIPIAESFAFPKHIVASRHLSQKPHHCDRSTQLFSIPDTIDIFTSGLASLVRLPRGVTVRPNANLENGPPPRLQRLYDVENSRACRKVREYVTELDLVVETVIPATPNSRCFTDKTYEYAIPADTMIPRLELNDAGKEMTLEGEDEILNYFNDKYSLGKGKDISDLLRVLGSELLGNLAGLLRSGRGNLVSNAALGDSTPRPEKPLVLYSYEGNQFCRLVREVLTELDIVYELRSVGKGSSRRQELADISARGSTQCPFLLDPNRDAALPESVDIVKYLYQHYARYTPPNELLQWTSDYVMKLAQPLFKWETPLQAGFYPPTSPEDGPATSASASEPVYNEALQAAREQIQDTVQTHPVVVYTYEWSPFSMETKSLFQNLEIEYHEVSLGKEWIPGLINEGGAETRAALQSMTGQSSLPHVFIGGQSIGGLYSGTPGLLALMERGTLLETIQEAEQKPKERSTNSKPNTMLKRK